MKKIISNLTITAILIINFTSCQLKNTNPASLVILNAKVVTIDKENPNAKAIAFIDDRIMAVSSNKKIKKYIKNGYTEVIDARGRLVIPGFNDAHLHFGPIDPDYIELRYTTDPNTITEKVKEAVGKSKPGQLIKGGHWEHEMFINKKWPTKELIDNVSPNNPVILSRADGHSVLVNSHVLKKSGITKDTPNPFGGEIQRDSITGEPTGILKETAQNLIITGAAKIKKTIEEENLHIIEGWLGALDMAKRLGVTSIQHAGDGDLTMYQKLKDLDKLTLRVDFSVKLTKDKNTLLKYDSLRIAYPKTNNWIRFGYLKDFIDGTLGSATMLVYEPFEDDPSNTGLPQMTYEELENKIVVADKMNFQIGIHAIGTKANTWILNAFEKAIEVNGRRDSRHRSEHAQILIESDIPRFSKLDVIASMQPTHCITDKRFCEKRIGYERSKWAYAWRSLLDAKAKIAFGTDYPVEPINPMEGLYAAVTRKDRFGEDGEGWIPNQKITMEEAIKLYTLGSAYAQFTEDRKGIIKKGYLGDVIIVEKDLLTIPHEQIINTKVDITIVGGKVVYKRDNL